jgi:hypothetical protein
VTAMAREDTSRTTACPGFAAEPGAAGQGPADQPSPVPGVEFRGTTVQLRSGPRAHRPLAQHERAGDWTLMAVVTGDTGPMAVFEEVHRARGRIVFVDERGLRLELRKSLEPTSAAGRPWYRGHAKEEVLPGQPDVLRYELLDGGQDPDPGEVRACFPPVRHAHFEGVDRPHTFIGTPESADVIPHYYRALPMVTRVTPEVVAPGTAAAMAAGNLWEGLVGGWLPVIRTVYPVSDDECWELIAFAATDEVTPFLQPAWYRYARLRGGEIQEIKYIDSHVPYPDLGPAGPDQFYRALARAHGYWQARLGTAMRVHTPEPWIADFCRHSLAREHISRRGDHPKYGIVDRAYGGEEHDGFQDALTNSVSCNLEWGLFAVARGHLDYYLRYFVRPDGTVRYRGPEIGKYGVMLSCLAQYADYSGDDTLLLDHDHKLKAIARFLVDRWLEARATDPGRADYGMIKGRHEADISFLTLTLNDLDYERPYLENSALIWRGLRDIAATWQRIGEAGQDPELLARAADLAAKATELLADARNGVDRSWIEKDGVAGLPIIAGSRTFYWEFPYRATPESFDENRVWSELFHSGILSRDTTQRILDLAGQRGGTTLGVFNNRVSLIGFLVSEAEQGLLQHDLIPEALLVFYAHAFHAHTRGTWTAIECVDMDRDRGAHSPYCVPAQATIPIITKWLLVYEDPVTRAVTLGQGAPRAWLADGREFGVDAAPTRWGRLGFRVRSHLRDGHVDAEIELPSRPGAEVRLRLRVPGDRIPGRVEVLGRDDVAARLAGDTVSLPPGSLGTVRVRVWYNAENGSQQTQG